MTKILLMVIISTALLTGCNHNVASIPKDIETRLEEVLKVDVVVPALENYQIKYAEVQYPPILHNKPVGNRLVARIVYTDEKGPLIELTKEQKAEMEERKERSILYGEYEGKAVIILEISNMKTSFADAKVQQIEGVDVEYSDKVVESGRYAFYSFNIGDGSYTTTFLLNDTFTDLDAVEYIKKLISELK